MLNDNRFFNLVKNNINEQYDYNYAYYNDFDRNPSD